MADSRLKRPSTLVAYWVGPRLVIHNYRLRRRIAVDASTIEILGLLSGWKSKKEIFTQFPQHPAASVESALESLIAHALLLREGTREADEDAAFEQAWGAWSHSAAWFHFSTKDVSYSALGSATEIKIRELLENSPEPDAFKDMAEQRPSYHLTVAGNSVDHFYNLLRARRTQRRFSSLPISYCDLAKLLIYTWGIVGYQHPALLRPLPLKTSPSAGGRHPGEVYVMALNVEGVEPGIYYYSPAENSLYLVASGSDPGAGGPTVWQPGVGERGGSAVLYDSCDCPEPVEVSASTDVPHITCRDRTFLPDVLPYGDSAESGSIQYHGVG
jgi:hypothetical protein